MAKKPQRVARLRHSPLWGRYQIVYGAAREIATALDGFTVVVTKSTVPIGTGDEVERIIRQAPPDADVAVVAKRAMARKVSAALGSPHGAAVPVEIRQDFVAAA